MSEAIRRDAVTCALAGIAAVDPGDLVRRAINKHDVPRAAAIVAVGKGASAMASAAIAEMGRGALGGVLIAPEAVTLDAPLRAFVGAHPVPDERSVAGARAVADLAASLADDDVLLCLISGGASALMTLPSEGLTVGDVAGTTNLLLRAGASIDELNCVRKHLDQLKGGRLAALAFPARVVSLVLSDVVGDSLPTIASGPTVADPTTIADAIAVLRARDLWDRIPAAVRAHLASGADESPKPGDARLSRSESHVIGSNVTAANAACAQARVMGYEACVVSTSLTGEASIAGGDIARAMLEERARTRSRTALIFAGEPTVTVRGVGSGGRNQELALGAALAMEGVAGVAVASLGTDGVDGPTDAAGAVADGDSISRARAAGLDPVDALARNDTHAFWKAIGGLVRTGPTGTNVMDIIVALAVPVTA